MFEIKKQFLVDENNRPVAVQISIEDYNRIEEAFENYGLAKLMDETRGDAVLSFIDAKKVARNRRAAR